MALLLSGFLGNAAKNGAKLHSVWFLLFLPRDFWENIILARKVRCENKTIAACNSIYSFKGNIFYLNFSNDSESGIEIQKE